MTWLPVLLLLIAQGWARDLHEARVTLVEKELPKRDGTIIDRRDEGVIVSRSQEEQELFPDYLALEVQADGERVKLLMLQRSADLDEGFAIESADGDFETIPAQRMTDAAMYQDLNSWAVFGVKRDEAGQRKYQGSFDVDGTYYSINRENDNRRGNSEYKMMRIERKALSNDVLKVSQDRLERINPKLTTRASNYKVEIGVLIDYTEYKFWLNQEKSVSKALNQINYKMTYVLNAMRMSYKTVSGITITPYFTKFKVNTRESESMIDDPYNQYTNSANLYLERWAEQAPGNGMAAGSDVDVGMWWANYDMCGDENCGVIGLAWLGAICDPNTGYYIVEDTGFDSWQTAAHELAHILGSEHDGDGNSCDGDAHYVMSPGAGWPPAGATNTVYDFSSCSNKYMTDKLASKSCLSNGARDGFTKVNDGLPGNHFTVDEQCKATFGSGSGECTWSPATDEWCSNGVSCQDPANAQYCLSNGAGAWEGTPCGGRKHCFNHKCVN